MVAKSENKHYNTVKFHTYLFFPSRNLSVPLHVFQNFVLALKKK